jgi:predicted nucleic acid-binding Zn ribbon protein
VSIQNQTLVVKTSVPALRADLSMRRRELVQQLNAHVGAQVITDIRFC